MEAAVKLETAIAANVLDLPPSDEPRQIGAHAEVLPHLPDGAPNGDAAGGDPWASVGRYRLEREVHRDTPRLLEPDRHDPEEREEPARGPGPTSWLRPSPGTASC
jgi:hypothetical protein